MQRTGLNALLAGWTLARHGHTAGRVANRITHGNRLNWLLAAVSLGGIVALMRHEGRRLVRERDASQQLQDWESEGGATATQTQVPGGDVGPGG